MPLLRVHRRCLLAAFASLLPVIGCQPSPPLTVMVDPTAAPPHASPSAAPPHVPQSAAPAKRTVPVPSVEPSCANKLPTKIYWCGAPDVTAAAAVFEAPFGACPIQHEGHDFSPAETVRRRVKHAGECCYLTTCQISYGY